MHQDLAFNTDQCKIRLRQTLSFIAACSTFLWMQVCKEAEITEIAVQSQEMPATDYLTVVQKDMTGDFTTKLPDKKS
jgi:hypothetical protein